MANPSINGHTLSVGGTHTNRDTPRPRISTSSLPSVEGVFVQRFGKGEAMWTGTGTLTATSHANLKSDVRTIQDDVNHTPSSYVDNDGESFDDCILLGYERGKIKRESATSFWCNVTWVIMQQRV